MNENKIRHLEMIHSIIARMASNCFVLKGWVVTLVSGIFVLSSKDSNKIYFLIAYIPLIAFWFLDSFYLRLEREFKVLYEKVRLKDDSEIDFNMRRGNINLTVDDSQKLCYGRCLFSITEAGFYVPCAALVTVLIFLVA